MRLPEPRNPGSAAPRDGPVGRANRNRQRAAAGTATQPLSRPTPRGSASALPGARAIETSSRRLARCAVLAAIGWIPLAAWAADTPRLPQTGERVDFDHDVYPLIQERCHACHGADAQTNGLRLDRRETALRGGYSGPAIVPHASARSPLILRVASDREGFRMPPGQEPLTSEEVGLLRAWIDQGAPWPQAEPENADPSRPRTEKHWSFQAIRRPEPPGVERSGWIRNPVDRFILARQEAKGVEPSPEADKRTLLRRLSLDLIGLPPTPAETEAFLEDTAPGAYERLADRLLDSRHYGEKWARHWLDLARYADSDGYTQDLDRPYAWRWRDWVIDALNDDMPFDEFTTLQLAADLLENPTPNQLAATGFHRNTLRNREGGTKYEQSRFEETLDRTNTVATAWLGLTVECAQCHDHKYDPITQADFYGLYAFFDNLRDIHIDAPVPGELGPYLSKRAEYEARRQALLEEHGVPALQPPWERELKIAAENPGARTDWDLCYDVLFQMTDGGWEVLRKPSGERTYREREMLTDYFVDWYQTVVSKERIEELRFKDLRKKLNALKASYPSLSEARIVRERAQPARTFLRLQGHWERKGIEVQPGTPAFLPSLRSRGRATRLDLARWLLAEENPLTARVAVNRMWQEFFGRGLVRTSEDFGTQGEAPSHPQLLDWLAAEFRSRAWSMKSMHKLIVMSATYRQASSARPELSQRDAENVWLARQNRLRLPAEIVRDSALRVSGLLAPAIGGPSVYPPQPKGVADLTYDWDTERWKASTGPNRYRRGLYTFFRRTAPYPQLMNFDAPDANRTVSRRHRSNTPLQALNLLNDEVFLEAARALAVRVVSGPPMDWNQRLERIFALTLCRLPTDREAERLAHSYRRQQRILAKSPSVAKQLALVNASGHSQADVAAWLGVGRILLNTDEFVTRE